MRKRRQFYAAPWVLFCTLPMFASCSGTDAELARLAASVISEDTTITTVVFGRATDEQGVPLAGVGVKLLGDRVYETETDGDGYYRFEDVFIARGEVFISSGSAGGTTSSNTDLNNATATYTILFKDSANRLATFRATASLTAIVYRTGNSYIYEALPYTFDATLVPFAGFTVKVLTGDANADAEPLPAANALVEVRPVAGADSANFETYAVQRSTNAAGVALFDARARLAAAAGYRVIVYPYDSLPDSPGYEYDLMVQNGVDLTPYSVFSNSGSGGYQLNELVLVLRDGAATNAQPTIAFSEPAAGDAIAPQSPIVVYFSRSMNPDSIEYRLEGCHGLAGSCDNNADANDVYVLTEELERTGMKLAFKPVDEITRIFNSFTLHVEGRTYDNVAMTASVTFSLDEQLVPENPDVPMPHLLLAAADSSNSENYYPAIDAAAIYIFDSTGFDDSTYQGTVYSRTGSLNPAWNATANVSGIDLYWTAVEGAAGYRVFGRDNNQVTSWIQLDEVGPSVRPPLDEAYVWTTIGDAVIAYFDYYNDAAITPFCCGNAVQIAVLPFYSQSAATPEISAERTMATLNPNRVLSLSDNYGPAIMNVASGNNLVSKQTAFNNLQYDAVGRIAFSEYMDYTQDPVIGPDMGDADSAGITIMSGRFGLAWTRWDEQSAHSAWTFEMEPAIVTADQLFVGDRLVDEDGTGTCTVTFIDACGSADTLVFCDGAQMPGPTYALLGPVRDAPDPTSFSYNGNITPSRSFLLAEELEENLFRDNTHGATWSRWAFVDGSNNVLYFADPDRPRNDPVPVAYLDNDIEANLDFTAGGGIFLSNQPTRALAMASVPADGEMKLNSVQGVINRVVTLLDNNPEMVAISGTDAGTQTATIGGSKFSHDAGTTVAFYPVAPLQADAASGDTSIVIDDPNNVDTTVGFFTTGMWIQIGTGANAEVVEVTGVNTGPFNGGSATLTIDRDPVAAGNDAIVLNHPAGELVTLVAGSVQVLASGVSVNTATGLRPGIPMTSTAGLNNNDEPYDTATYTLCAVGTHNDKAGGGAYSGLFARSNNDLYRVNTGADKILPFAEADLRPGDTIMIRGRDAAGNAMRPNGALLKGDGTVE